MTRRITLLIGAALMVFGLQAQGLKGAFKKLKEEVIPTSLTDEEIGGGLKEALNIGRWGKRLIFSPLKMAITKVLTRSCFRRKLRR